MTNQDLIEGKKKLLELEKLEEIRRVQTEASENGLLSSGDYHNIVGRIELKYDAKKRIVELSPTPKDEVDLRVGNDHVPTWPDELHWNESGSSYLLGETVFKISGKRRKIFKEIVDNKGGWVLTRDIAKKNGESEKKIKIILFQISNRLKESAFKKLLLIKPRNDNSLPSAYKAVPYPKA